MQMLQQCERDFNIPPQFFSKTVTIYLDDAVNLISEDDLKNARTVVGLILPDSDLNEKYIKMLVEKGGFEFTRL